MLIFTNPLRSALAPAEPRESNPSKVAIAAIAVAAVGVGGYAIYHFTRKPEANGTDTGLEGTVGPDGSLPPPVALPIWPTNVPDVVPAPPVPGAVVTMKEGYGILHSKSDYQVTFYSTAFDPQTLRLWVDLNRTWVRASLTGRTPDPSLLRWVAITGWAQGLSA